MKALREQWQAMASETNFPLLWSLLTAGSLALTIALFILAHNS